MDDTTQLSWPAFCLSEEAYCHRSILFLLDAREKSANPRIQTEGNRIHRVYVCVCARPVEARMAEQSVSISSEPDRKMVMYAIRSRLKFVIKLARYDISAGRVNFGLMRFEHVIENTYRVDL